VIAVLGATGRIGRHVAAELAEQGASARALVRTPDAADLPLPAVAADLRDPASLRRGLDGAERMLLLTPHGPDQQALEANAIDAAAAAGIERIVKISGGAPSLGPNGPTATAVAHWRSERRIEDSGLGFTFLRPSFVMQNLLETAADLVTKVRVLAAPMGRAPIAMVDARDVAACAVAALVDRDPVDQAWHLTGPRRVTYPDLARLLHARYVDVPAKLAAQAMARRGASPWEVDHALGMAAYFAAGSDGTPTDAVRRLTGHDPRSVEDFVNEHAGAFRRGG
jgi:NAD(P)H dehydrogenase (quinone)